MKPLAKPGKAAAKVPQRRKAHRYRKRVAAERRARAGGAKSAAKRVTRREAWTGTLDLDRRGNSTVFT